jgi:diaminopimelate epimerase
MMIEFIKCHGLGNDYLFIDLFKQKLPERLSLSKLAIAMSDRRLGAGSDGIVLLAPHKDAAAQMRIFNADGSEAETCGNALRCIARLLWENSRTRSDQFTLMTAAGAARVRVHRTGELFESAEINMGRPKWDAESIPATGFKDGRDAVVNLDSRLIPASCVSIGNPHCVILDPDAISLPLQIFGPRIETHPMFPKRINVEFLRIVDRKTLKVDVWERGSGITAACGTGACASFCAARSKNLCDANAQVILPGGSLDISENAEGEILMRGPATKVYTGTWDCHSFVTASYEKQRE